MAIYNAHVFPGFLTPILTQISFQSHRLLFSHALAEVRRRKYAAKKFRLNRVSNSQPLGHESDTLTIEPPGRDQHMIGGTKWCLFPLFQSSIYHTPTPNLVRGGGVYVGVSVSVCWSVCPSASLYLFFRPALFFRKLTGELKKKNFTQIDG